MDALSTGVNQVRAITRSVSCDFCDQIHASDIKKILPPPKHDTKTITLTLATNTYMHPALRTVLVVLYIYNECVV
jgi:hypothetical protein